MLDDRKLSVLRAIIEDYVTTEEPVGSKALVDRHHLGVSSATVRNDMAALEEDGYIQQPHTSAGRVPTDKAYRFYVDSFPPPRTQPASGPSLPTRRSGVDGFMEKTSSHLSAITRLTGLLLAPPLQQTRLARIDVIPLEHDRALAVAATDTGWITVREIVLEPPLGAEEARAIGRDLTRRFGGRTVQDIYEKEGAGVVFIEASGVASEQSLYARPCPCSNVRYKY